MEYVKHPKSLSERIKENRELWSAVPALGEKVEQCIPGGGQKMGRVISRCGMEFKVDWGDSDIKTYMLCPGVEAAR